MGYLNNATTVLDAVLTKKGRELLARGQNEFQITKFALADDEVDYSLWDETNPLGTDYYGSVIENLPLFVSYTDEEITFEQFASYASGSTETLIDNTRVKVVILKFMVA